MASSVPVYLVFGPQGSGKSTQAELIAQYLRLPFFDSGKELRSLATSDSPDAEKVAQIMQSGQLVPNVILRITFDRFIKANDCSRGLVTDGFPRNLVQVQLFEDLARDYHWDVIGFYVKISDQTAKERLAKRYTVVDGRKVIRDDDQPLIVEKRLAVFRQETLPVIEWLRQYAQVIDIDGEPDRQAVFNQIKERIDG